MNAIYKSVNMLQIIENSTISDCLKTCMELMESLDKTHKTIGSRKYAYSRLRGQIAQYKDNLQFITPWLQAYTRQEYAQDLLKHAAKLRSQKMCIADINAVIVYSLIRLSPSESREYKIQSKQAIISDMDFSQNRRVFKNPDEYLRLIESLLESTNSAYSVIVALCAATGRRSYETAVTGNFEVIDSNKLVFCGQAKTRNTEKSLDEYVIPCLADGNLVVDVFKSFKSVYKQYDGIDSQKFHAAHSKDIRLKTRKLFNKHCENISTKDLRAIYALLCWRIFDEEKTAKTLYYSRILGHSDQDIMTAQSYDDFILE